MILKLFVTFVNFGSDPYSLLAFWERARVREFTLE